MNGTIDLQLFNNVKKVVSEIKKRDEIQSTYDSSAAGLHFFEM